MGRTLETLKRACGQAEERPEEIPAASADTPHLQLVADEEPADDEMPYIEVGGRGKPLDASPGVLATAAATPPALQPPPPRGVVLAESGPRTVAFKPARRAAPAALIPRIPAEVIAFHQPEHPVSAQYQTLLGQIVPEAVEGPGEILLFTALSAAAGVTTALLNLAVCASRADGRQVIVVDANLKRPALANRLGLAEAPGLHEAVVGSAALDQVVRATAQEHLHAVTAGKAPRAGALTPEAVRWVTAWLRHRFDLIFLDGPAWEEGPETAALVGAVDGVLLVLDHGEVNRPQIRAATRAIARMGGKLGGLLVTQ